MVTDRAHAREREILADTLRYCDRRLAEIEALAGRLGPGSYQRSELLSEAGTLTGTRNAAALRLRELDGADDAEERERRVKDQARVAQMRDARARAYRSQCEEQAREAERIGDHRAAKNFRLEGLRAHTVAAWEIHE